MSAIIALEDVTLRYESTAILDNLSLDVQPGEVLALLGPSGSGKSTLLRLIMGFMTPDQGVIRLRGQTVSKGRAVLTPPQERNLAVVFQDLALWPHLTVAANLAFGLRSKGVSRDEERRRTIRILDRVGLAGMAERYPGQLSGGEQQRVAIARALVLEPEAVLLDEPLANLDVRLRDDLLELFSTLFHEVGATVLYVTHDPWEAMGIGDRVAVLDQGKILFAGKLDSLDPEDESPFIQSICHHLRRQQAEPQ